MWPAARHYYNPPTMNHRRRCWSLITLVFLFSLIGLRSTDAQSIVSRTLRASLEQGTLAGRNFDVSFTYNADEVNPQGDSWIGLSAFDFVLDGVTFSRRLISQGGQVIFRDGVLNNVTASFQGRMPDGSPVMNITFGFGGPRVIGYIDLNGAYGQGSFVVDAPTPLSGVLITSGSLEMNGPSGSLLLGGTGGFLLDAAVSTADGVFGPTVCGSSPRACTAGSMLDLTGLWVGGSVRGTAAVGPDVYRSLGSAAGTNQVSLNFQGGALLPATGGGPTIVQAPFAFSGSLDHPDASGAPGRLPLSGRGTAIITLSANPAVADTWAVSRVVYAFAPALGDGWVAADIGATGLPGDTVAVGDQFLVAGSGSDVWGRADSFRYVFRSAPSDSEIVTRVDAQVTRHPFAKAGVMVRAGIEPGAAHAILDIKPGGGLEFMSRSVTDGDTAFIAGAQASYPVSLRLQRSETRVTAAYSSDGLTWIELGTIQLGASRFWGVAVTSHDPYALNDATFARPVVRETPRSLPAGWSSSDIGTAGIVGASAFADGAFRVSGAGEDIWAAADGFHFVSQEAGGDLTLVARVVRLEDTDPFAKAGLMIRASDDADAAHVTVDVRPNGEIEFLSRESAGAVTEYLGGTAGTFPAWLMLRRTGAVVTAYTSRDGFSWIALGSVRPDFSIGVLAGLAVTSHNVTRATVAEIDQVSLRR